MEITNTGGWNYNFLRSRLSERATKSLNVVTSPQIFYRICTREDNAGVLRSVTEFVNVRGYRRYGRLLHGVSRVPSLRTNEIELLSATSERGKRPSKKRNVSNALHTKSDENYAKF